VNDPIPVVEEKVLVLDFGAQYSQLIARRVRECGVYCEIVPGKVKAEDILRERPQGLILSGGPASVYEPNAPRCDPEIFRLGLPILGICYGFQLMAHLLGGEVRASAQREYGPAQLEVLQPNHLFADLPPQLRCWMSHGDEVVALPAGFVALARTANCSYAAAADEHRHLYGVQFHPEVSHTRRGREILYNFLTRGCRCRGTWSMASFVQAAIPRLREQIGAGRVLCALSGGVDSAVAATLVHRAVGNQLVCVFVNHGLLRAGEPEQVQRTFGEHFKMHLVTVDARERFLACLQGVEDPEEKRRRIGQEFVTVFEEQSRKLGPFEFLAQGTIYPDVIESGTQFAATIKTHHNVGGLPDNLGFQLVEPLRYLFKDEVRRVGEQLGLPPEIVYRQPFPGPGLAIRILGEVTRERLEIVRQADAIVGEEIERAGLHREVSQFFAVLAPIRSVGVMGDHRTYAYPIIVRAVTTDDFMTAHWAQLPAEVLERIATRIVNEVPGVNRCVYDISSKPPATIEWE